jgi:ATP phosphoribosyltransferase regulatory subunit
VNPAKRSVSEYLSRGVTPLVSPKGMGDLLPPEAAERRALARKVLHVFELSGYELITPPVFEHAEVVARGNDALESRDLLRFVEPESGEVAVLRPDITPQIARIVATRLAKRPSPFRLCYEGRVFRRQRGRARSHRQVSQCGVECVGLGGVEGDTESIALAARACTEVGLRDFRIELSDIRLVRSLLDQVPEAARAAVTETMAAKDVTALAAVLHNCGIGKTLTGRLTALVGCYGGPEVLAEARKRFRWAEARKALGSLHELTRRLGALGLADRIGFDLGETRGLSYYTGVHFNVLAPGPGEALGGGGRYDSLLSRFGLDAPATGFALDLRNLQWTLHNAGVTVDAGSPTRVAVAGTDGACVARVADTLRAAGVVAATVPGDPGAALAFAQAWGYDAALVVARGAPTLQLAAQDDAAGLEAAEVERIRRLARDAAK